MTRPGERRRSRTRLWLFAGGTIATAGCMGAETPSCGLLDSPQATSGPQSIGFAIDAGAVLPDGNTPTGSLLPVTVNAFGVGQGTMQPSGPVANLPLAFSALPASISVSPPAASTDNYGNATTYALVPYDTQGIVTVTGTGVEQQVPVANGPVTLSLTVTPAVFDAGALDGGLLGSSGQVYTAFVSAQAHDAGVPGLPVVLTIVQPSSASSGSSSGGASGDGGSAGGSSSSGGGGAGGSTSLVTSVDGGVATNVLVPWGASAIVSVSGGGSVLWSTVADGGLLGNPVQLSALQVVPLTIGATIPIYAVCTQATINGVPVPGASVTFSLLASSPDAGSAGTVSPTSIATNQSGCAEVVASTSLAAVGVEAFVAGSLPVVSSLVTAASASTTTPCTCTAASDAGTD